MASQRDDQNSATGPQIRAKAEELIQTTGLPRNLAFQVAMGNLTLNEVLEKLAFRDEVEKLIRRHSFPRSLATQIAMGQVNLDDILQKQRLRDYIEENRERSLLVEAAASGQRVTLLLHGQRRKSGKVLKVNQYDFEFQGKKGDPETIHKLQARAGWDARRNAAVLSSFKKDKNRSKEEEPILKPQDRYHCSNRRLFQHMEASDRLIVHLLEGDVVTGTVDWLSRWEFGLKTKKGHVVTIFRHAMIDLEVK
ncbi:MAG: hypothetical protein AAFV53_31655 [Myxococcota bacterium]